MTERPDTSMSVRTTATTATNAPLVVKKVRATGTAKKDAPKAPRAKKAAAGGAKTGSKPDSPTRPLASRAPTSKDKGGGDVDNITSGIKKITLVTNKQKEARARENNKKPADTAKDQAANGSLGSSLPITTNQKIMSQEASLPVDGHNPLEATPGKPQDAPHQEAPITPVFGTTGGITAGIKTPTRPPPDTETTTPEVFVHYQPDGGQPETLTPQGPLTWLPVNTGATPSPMKQAAPVREKNGEPATATMARTPSPAQTIDHAAATPSPMRRGDLPVFTPNSQLKFAPRSPAEQSSTSSTPPRIKHEAERRLGDALWEVPETPQ